MSRLHLPLLLTLLLPLPGGCTRPATIDLPEPEPYTGLLIGEGMDSVMMTTEDFGGSGLTVSVDLREFLLYLDFLEGEALWGSYVDFDGVIDTPYGSFAASRDDKVGYRLEGTAIQSGGILSLEVWIEGMPEMLTLSCSIDLEAIDVETLCRVFEIPLLMSF